MAGDGLKITLAGIGGGLTVDKNGRALLPTPLVFQCPPLETYQITHAFNFGTYDTIDDDQYSRRGSRQLRTWQFDTLIMYMGVQMAPTSFVQDPRVMKPTSQHFVGLTPSWVPYPRKQPGAANQHQQRRPEWYVDQIRNIFVAGAPFKYTAAFKNSTVIHMTYATLTGFTEDYKHGEGDAIYLDAVSFMEWRDPRGKTPQGTAKLPAHVRFRKAPPNNRYIAYDIKTNKNIKTKAARTGTTFADLARHYYGNGTQWRHIMKANKCKGGSGNVPIFTHWYPKRLSRGKPNVTVTVPTKPK